MESGKKGGFQTLKEKLGKNISKKSEVTGIKCCDKSDKKFSWEKNRESCKMSIATINS